MIMWKSKFVRVVNKEKKNEGKLAVWDDREYLEKYFYLLFYNRVEFVKKKDIIKCSQTDSEMHNKL